MSDKMSDEQVGTELERRDPELRLIFDRTIPVEGETLVDGAIWQKTLRLLADSQAVLGEIDGLLQHQLDNEEPDDLVTILQLLEVLKQIARKHYRGGK